MGSMTEQAEPPVFTLRTVGIEARGVPIPEGFKVLAGSTARLRSDFVVNPEDAVLRQRLLKDGSVVEQPGTGSGILTRDIEFRTASQATAILCGSSNMSSSGWVTQGDAGQTITYGDWRKTRRRGESPELEQQAPWPPFFRELATRLLEFEDRQPELVQLLREVGVTVNHDEGQPLTVLDPFSFFSLILKSRSDVKALSLFGRVRERLGLEAAVPSDLTGVPWSNPMNAWFFAYRSARQPDDLPVLWALARQALEGNLLAETFDRALAIHKVALSKLTQGLFWVNPEKFLALNSINIPYLQARGVAGAGRVRNLPEYLNVLHRARQLAPSFLDLSQRAWLASRDTSPGEFGNGGFPFAQFQEEAARHDADRVRGNMLLDRRYAPPLLEALEDAGEHLRAERDPYSGSAQLAVKVSLGGAEGRWYARALLLPQPGYDYHDLPAGLTLEVALPDGHGDELREVLREGGQRERLVEALVAGSAFHLPPLLALDSDSGRVTLLPLMPEERARAAEALTTYAVGFGKGRRLRVGVTLSPGELESDAFAEHLHLALTYLNRVAAVLDDLTREDGLPPDLLPVIRAPLNQILYGPPGTGKTYRVVDEALDILDPAFLAAHPGLEGRAARKARYDELEREGRITFVTFHQSFGYEDFVEGIKPVMRGQELRYELEDGLFLRAVRAAGGELEGGEAAPSSPPLGPDVNPQGQVWRLYIDGTAPVSQVRERSVARGEIRIGSWLSGSLTLDGRPPATSPRPADLNGLPEDQLNAQQHAFKDSLRTGDLVLLATGKDRIGAVGAVSGDYRFDPHSEAVFGPNYAHARPVRWLATGLNLSAQEVTGKNFSQQTLQRVLGVTPEGVLRFLPQGRRPAARPRSHVLIIDEINRGNVAKVFGELITLLEESKRAGAPEALSAVLPLSKRRLGVPGGLYVIGTMNTADRSLTQLDAALRRRFVFRSVWPQPEVLPVLDLGGIALDLRKFLYAINLRIEALLGREQVIGHAYLLGLPPTLEGVASALRGRILPLLEEYFFEDWDKIRQVLGDDAKPGGLQFVGKRPLGESAQYFANLESDLDVEAFVRVYSGLDDAAFPFA